MSKDDFEGVIVNPFNTTFLGHRAEDWKPSCHLFHECCSDRLGDLDDIFLFVAVACAQYFIDDIPVVGEEDEALGVFIEPSHRKQALGVVDEADDIFRFFWVCGTNDPDGFIESNVEGFRFIFKGFSIQEYQVAVKNAVAFDGNCAIDC